MRKPSNRELTVDQLKQKHEQAEQVSGDQLTG
jgi:hypothetical protein